MNSWEWLRDACIKANLSVVIAVCCLVIASSVPVIALCSGRSLWKQMTSLTALLADQCKSWSSCEALVVATGCNDWCCWGEGVVAARGSHERVYRILFRSWREGSKIRLCAVRSAEEFLWMGSRNWSVGIVVVGGRWGLSERDRVFSWLFVRLVVPGVVFADNW